jgi:spermidine synthase
MPAHSMNDSRRVSWLLLPLFFGSGFAALLYQMVWQRLLTLFGGADVYSVTIIVASFMVGLGFGSLAGGHVADRLGLRGRFLAFAGAELAIALFALVSVPLIHDVLYARLAPLGLSRVTTAAILLLVLLWPTFFMGMSLPLLAKAISMRDRPPEEWIGALYGVNTLGAAVGSLVTVWVLARLVGFERSVQIGALINLGCAAGGFVLARGASRADPGGEGAVPMVGAAPVATSTFSFPTWTAVYALSGFIALSLEILWFRILGVVLKSNSFTFATLLAIYLAGLGGGALLGSRGARRAANAGEAFLILQSAITLYAGFSVAFLTRALEKVDALDLLWHYLGDYEALDIGVGLHDTARFIAHGGRVVGLVQDRTLLFFTLYGAVPALVVGVPTLLMGASFAFLQRAAQTDPGLVGRRVGGLQTANIVGSTVGAVLTGLALLGVLGSALSLRLLVVLGATFPLLLARVRPGRRGLPVAAFGAALWVAWLVPDGATLWSRLHGAAPGAVVEAEDGSGLSVLRSHDGGASVFVNGLGQSEIPYGGGHTRLGMLPVLLHPNPRRIAIVGLGSGDTVFSASGRLETERIDCVEIVAPQLDTLRLLAARQTYPALTGLLGDARIRYTFTDGRAFLARRRELYDVIEADALRPSSAYSGNLYSLEYFTLVRRRLSPGGFGVTWGPTPRILETFRAVFPHVLRFDDILIGSEEPVAFDRTALEMRLREAFTRDQYRRGGLDAAAELEPVLMRPPVAYGPGGSRRDVNTDLFPKDEYGAP